MEIRHETAVERWYVYELASNGLILEEVCCDRRKLMMDLRWNHCNWMSLCLESSLDRTVQLTMEIRHETAVEPGMRRNRL